MGADEAGTPDIARTLDDIKRLLILALLSDGYSQASLASALGVSQATISRMFPGGLTLRKPKGLE